MAILSSASMSITQPPRIGGAEPVSVVPRPRVVTGTRCRLASSSTAPICASEHTLITASGRNGIFALSNDTAVSEASSVRTTRAPRRRLRSEVAAPNDFIAQTNDSGADVAQLDPGVSAKYANGRENDRRTSILNHG